MPLPDYSCRPFGNLADGREVVACRLRLHDEFTVEVIAYGGIITSIRTPDRKGHMANIVLGFDDLAPYLLDKHYLGAIIGRVANRISFGRCALHGQHLHLSVNHPPHHLHGGFQGLHNRLWTLQPFRGDDHVGVTCLTSLADGEEGYPGHLDVAVTYLLQSPDTLLIRYSAASTQDSFFNPTQHSYFNLDPERDTILDHFLMIAGGACLETDHQLIPTGRLLAVAGTRLELSNPRSLRTLAERGMTIDHSWILPERSTGDVIASLSSPRSGRKIDVVTDAPTLHVYAGHGLASDALPSAQKALRPYAGICLETQGYTDAPNHPHFPSIGISAGQRWASETRFIFSTET